MIPSTNLNCRKPSWQMDDIAAKKGINNSHITYVTNVITKNIFQKKKPRKNINLLAKKNVENKHGKLINTDWEQIKSKPRKVSVTFFYLHTSHDCFTLT